MRFLVGGTQFETQNSFVCLMHNGDFIKILNNFVHKTEFHGVELSTCGIKPQILDFEAFEIFPQLAF
jgi:hypothetical protein